MAIENVVKWVPLIVIAVSLVGTTTASQFQIAENKKDITTLQQVDKEITDAKIQRAEIKGDLKHLTEATKELKQLILDLRK